MITLKKILVNIMFTIFVFPVFLLAQGVTGGNGSGGSISIDIPNPATKAGGNLIDLLRTILNSIVMPIAAVAVVMWIVYAGFTYVTAQGNPAKIEKAHQRLLWSLIGAGILLGAAGISFVVQNTVGALLN